MSKDNGVIRIGDGGEVTTREMKDWLIVVSGGQQFLGRPTGDKNEDGRLFNPCYAHAIVQKHAADGTVQFGRSLQILALLVGQKAARIRTDVEISLFNLPEFELEELVRCVKMVEQERAQFRQMKSGILTPQILPPRDVRG